MILLSFVYDLYCYICIECCGGHCNEMFINIWLRLHISRSVWDKYWNIYLKGGVIVTVEPTYLEERHHSGRYYKND